MKIKDKDKDKDKDKMINDEDNIKQRIENKRKKDNSIIE